MENACISRTRVIKPGIILLALFAAFCIFTGCGKDSEKPEQDAVMIETSAPEEIAAVSGTDTAGSAEVSPTDWYAGLSGEDRAIADMIISSTDAFNAEDIDAYMLFIDGSSPGYASTREDTAELFDNYQLIATIDDIKVDSLNEAKGTAKVTVTQTTVRDGKEGKGFAPVQNVLRHELVRRDGEWFFLSTTVVSRRELTDRWSMFIEFAADPPVSDSDAVEASGTD